MTRLTEVLSRSGGHRNPERNFKKFINYGVINYQHCKNRQPNTLGNRVSEQTPRQRESACSDKMLVMMACWKRNDFRENTCNEEYNDFAKCMADVRAKALKDQAFIDSAELGHVSEDGKMNPKQINKLLKMYPQPPYKVTLTHGKGHPLPEPIVFKQVKEDNTQQSAPKPLWKKTSRDKYY